jgi:hypothetical protein
MRFLLLLPLFIFLHSKPVKAQNLYDIPRSKEFANYLVHSQHYSLAAIELERLIYLEPQNDTLRESLIKCYTRNKEFATAGKRLDAFFPNKKFISAPFDDLYAFNLLADKKTHAARDFLSINATLDFEKRHYYQAFSYLLEQDFNNSERLLAEIPLDESSLSPLRDLSHAGLTMRRKSPGLAMAMSTLVPGSGKFYTGDWKDGIISLISVGITSFQAIRGFSINGTSSTYGWIYGSIATGFYLGNIYGSFTSAKRYNKRQADKLAQKTDAAFFLHP